MSDSWKVETSDEAFQVDVEDASHKQLVIVDFWAAWCQPCRMLEPILDQVIGSFEGRVRLAKAETDHSPQAAGRYGVQGIPAVYAVAFGEVVDGFSGVMPEAAIEEWIKQHLLVFDIELAIRLGKDDPVQAIEKLRELHDQNPKDAKATIGLAGLLVGQEEFEGAAELISELEQRGFLETEAEALKTKIELASREQVDLGEIEARLAQAPEDPELQMEFANALATNSQYEQALSTLLEVVRNTAGEQKDQAREKMVELFRVLDDEELVREFRKQLSLALY